MQENEDEDEVEVEDEYYLEEDDASEISTDDENQFVFFLEVITYIRVFIMTYAFVHTKIAKVDKQCVYIGGEKLNHGGIMKNWKQLCVALPLT